MNVGYDEDEDEAFGRLTDREISDNYDYVGAEIGFSIRTTLGDGNYRILYARTSRDFLDPTGTSAVHHDKLALSFDQELSRGLGAFLRIGARSDEAAVYHDSFYSAGINICGRHWGREKDNIGLGVAYLNGGNLDIESTRVAEGYYRLAIVDRFGLTADLQYMHDDKKSGADPEGFVFGLRADLDF